MNPERVVIVAGPRRGKSTLARTFALIGYPVFCGDPLSKVKEPLPGVTYLPEGIPFSGDVGAAQWIADNWFPMPGPWVCEGHVMARALRRWMANYAPPDAAPFDRVIVLDRPAFVEASKGQESMHKAVMSVWDSIADSFNEWPDVEVETLQA